MTVSLWTLVQDGIKGGGPVSFGASGVDFDAKKAVGIGGPDDGVAATE